jgi:hypothetical protein
MNKTTCVLYSPISTSSGYGSCGRNFAKSLIELKGEEWDIKIISCNWGNTPKNFIQDNEEWEFLNKYIIPLPLQFQPDIFIMHTIPSEFQPIGKFNIGLTPAIETTLAAADWIEGCERMNMVLCSSNHSLNVLKASKYEKRNEQTQQSEGLIEWTKKGEVLFEGMDIEIFKPLNKVELDLSSIKEDFCYLFTGLWSNGDFGHDRKNVGLTIKAFLETFKNKSKQPALILKTTQVGASYPDRKELLKRIEVIKSSVNSKNLPNIYLFHGEVSDKELNELYNHPKVKAMVSFNKGEGFGRPLLEFSLVNKPIICSGWSGHMDYLNSDFTTLIPGDMEKVHPSVANNMLLKEADWFKPDTSHIGTQMRNMFENYKPYLEKAKRQGFQSRNNFSLDKMKERLNVLLKDNIPSFPKTMELKLPAYKKIELPKLNKVNI